MKQKVVVAKMYSIIYEKNVRGKARNEKMFLQITFFSCALLKLSINFVGIKLNFSYFISDSLFFALCLNHNF